MNERKEMVAQMSEILDKLAASRAEDLGAMASDVNETVSAYGFTREDLLGYWGCAKYPLPVEGSATTIETVKPVTRLYALQSDPTKTYGFRGPAPKWLKAAVASDGGDPESSVDRLAFRAKYMDLV